jgi:hypothetical protein
MPLNKTEAASLLRKVVDDLWAANHKPILGARLKATFLNYVLKSGKEFNERELGFANFASFLKDIGIVTIAFRQGTDLLVVPIGQEEILSQVSPIERPKRIRRDFWDAFIRFPSAAEVRAYDRERDVIVIGLASSIPVNATKITPISKEEQLRWRKDFIASLGSDSPLASLSSSLAQAPTQAFAVFSDALKNYPQLRPKWNQFWKDRIAGLIKEWGLLHGISEDIWHVTEAKGKTDDLRAKLYAVLDSIPIDNLLEIKIPLKWLVDK